MLMTKRAAGEEKRRVKEEGRVSAGEEARCQSTNEEEEEK